MMTSPIKWRPCIQSDITTMPIDNQDIPLSADVGCVCGGAKKRRRRSRSRSRSIPAVGGRASVMHGNARHTSGGLTASDLMYNKAGRIVSKRKHAAGKRLYSEYGREYKDIIRAHQF